MRFAATRRPEPPNADLGREPAAVGDALIAGYEAHAAPTGVLRRLAASFRAVVI